MCLRISFVPLLLFAFIISLGSCKKNKEAIEIETPVVVLDDSTAQTLLFGNDCNTYSRSYLGSILNSFIATADGGYLFCGKGFSSDGTFHSYILKTNCFGEKEWEQRFKTETNSEANHIVPVNNEDYIFYSIQYDPENASAYTSHISRGNKNGDLIWSKKHDIKTNIDFRNICTTPNVSGLISLVSDYNSSFNGESILKTDFLGNEVFSRRLMGDGRYHFITSLPDGSFIAVGESNNSPIIMKLNSQGDSLWTKSVAIPGQSAAFYANTIANGDIVLMGISKNSQTNIARTLFSSRLTATGNTLWSRLYPDEDFLDFKDADLSIDGNLLTNVTKEDTAAPLSRLLKIDLNNGSVIWERNAGSLLGNTIISTADNAMIYIGNEISKRESYIRKTDSNGF